MSELGKTAGKKDWLLFIGAAVLALILMLLGGALLFMDASSFDSTFFYLTALLLLTGGVLVAMSSPSEYWIPALALGALGAYSLARATDIIQLPWLAIITGLLSWLAAVILLYITYPENAVRRKTDRQ